jgi:hypothetical protein
MPLILKNKNNALRNFSQHSHPSKTLFKDFTLNLIRFSFDRSKEKLGKRKISRW